jgi:hypothetical protein
MEQMNCNSIKNSLVGFLGEEIRVVESSDGCVLVLPGKTLDDRHPAIFVDQRMDDYFLVHDAGKTAAELYAQGVHITDSREDAFSEMAERLGAVFSKGMFQVGCNRADLHQAILAVGQCESLGMWHILGHKPDFSDEPIASRVEQGIRAWNAPYENRIESRFSVQGVTSKHVFDFVSFPVHVQREVIALKILRPGDDPISKAKEYGYLALDIRATQYEAWPRLAIMTKAEKWSKNAREIVKQHSAAMVEVETGEEESVEALIPQKLEEMAA